MRSIRVGEQAAKGNDRRTRRAGHPGVAPSTLGKQQRIDLAELQPPRSREPLILFVGRVGPEKGPDMLVAACSQVLPQLAGWRAELVETAVSQTLAYYAFPEEHWRRIRTNNPLERIMREIRRRTRVVGAFPDGNSAINLAAARLRHIAGSRWSTKRYLNMKLLRQRNAITA